MRKRVVFPLLVMATLLLWAALLTVQLMAQEDSGSIPGLTLVSDNPGEMVISWSLPDTEPSDYRISWAPVGEGFLSYRGPNEAGRGNDYPVGSSLSYAVTGLSAGAEYKVRMRARYNAGEYAGNPWSGPWANATITLASAPDPAPEPTEEPTPAPEPRDGTVQPKDTQSGDQCPDPTPTEIVVSSVPIQVSSTASDYFVLYANVGGSDIPVQVKRGESGTTTLEENIKALPASDYRVEKYAVADPADVDGDCLDDLTDPSPLNHSYRVELDPADGAMVIADSAHFWNLATTYGTVRFTLIEVDSSTPELYFQNTKTHQSHLPFLDLLGIDVHLQNLGPRVASIRFVHFP